jgi:hypothetical protein
MREHYRKVGDVYPPLRFQDGSGVPINLACCRVTWDFVPDSPRARAVAGRDLQILDAANGLVEAPRSRARGLGEVTIHYPAGLAETPLERIRFVK